MEKYLKYLPLGLFVSYGVKSLLTSTSYIDAAMLAVLGMSAFSYEFFIQTKRLHFMESEVLKFREELKFTQKELDTTKAYVTSIKLNGMRSANGFSK